MHKCNELNDNDLLWLKIWLHLPKKDNNVDIGPLVCSSRPCFHSWKLNMLKLIYAVSYFFFIFILFLFPKTPLLKGWQESEQNDWQTEGVSDWLNTQIGSSSDAFISHSIHMSALCQVAATFYVVYYSIFKNMCMFLKQEHL